MDPGRGPRHSFQGGHLPERSPSESSCCDSPPCISPSTLVLSLDSVLPDRSEGASGRAALKPSVLLLEEGGRVKPWRR